MPVLGLIFLRYTYSRFKYVEAEILKDRPVRNGRVLPVPEIDTINKWYGKIVNLQNTCLEDK